MSINVVINSWEELQKYFNDNKVLEIVQRNAKKRYDEFVNVSMNIPAEKEQKETLRNTVQKLLGSNQKQVNQLFKVTKLQSFDLLLGGVNMCATCSGFAVMYAKLDKMSAEIGRQIRALQDTVKKGQDVQAEYEFQKVLSEHSNMLDSERRQQPYSENQMRELVDAEYNVLSMLINVLNKDVSYDQQALIFSIYSLASMLAVSLRKYDEEYYFNNHAVLGDQNVWHTSHDKWTAIFDTLTSEWFVEKLQDLAIFELDMNTTETDAYYLTLLEQAQDMKGSIKDNQDLIVALGDIDVLNAVRDFSKQQVVSDIAEAFKQADIQSDSPVAAIGNEVMKQIGLA